MGPSKIRRKEHSVGSIPVAELLDCHLCFPLWQGRVESFKWKQRFSSDFNSAAAGIFRKKLKLRLHRLPGSRARLVTLSKAVASQWSFALCDVVCFLWEGNGCFRVLLMRGICSSASWALTLLLNCAYSSRWHHAFICPFPLVFTVISLDLKFLQVGVSGCFWSASGPGVLLLHSRSDPWCFCARTRRKGPAARYGSQQKVWQKARNPFRKFGYNEFLEHLCDGDSEKWDRRQQNPSLSFKSELDVAIWHRPEVATSLYIFSMWWLQTSANSLK